jgi:glutaredoxin
MDMDIVLYGRAGDPDSETMRDYFDSRGIDYRMRTIDVDRDARQEWEDLDGQVTPVITIDRTQIVRGLDCTRLENFIGWVGC